MVAQAFELSNGASAFWMNAFHSTVTKSVSDILFCQYNSLKSLVTELHGTSVMWVARQFINSLIIVITLLFRMSQVYGSVVDAKRYIVKPPLVVNYQFNNSIGMKWTSVGQLDLLPDVKDKIHHSIG